MVSQKAQLSISGEAAAEFVEKKSRFIGQIAAVADEDAAKAFLQRISTEHRAATHNCYAWVVGENDICQHSSDAGEPAGTAGRPILEAIKRAELHNVAIVVTRYFGGIMLGAGGLTRAYAKAAHLAIEAAEQVRCVSAGKYALSFDYALLGKIEAAFGKFGVEISSKVFAEQVAMIIVLEDEKKDMLQQEITNISNGKLQLFDLGEQVVLQQPL